jgi:hypothetical protein
MFKQTLIAAALQWTQELELLAARTTPSPYG